MRSRASAAIRYLAPGPHFGISLIMVIALAGSLHTGLAQDQTLVPDSSIAIPPLQFDSSGALVIRASSTSSEHDFDYLVGTWKLKNRKTGFAADPFHGVGIVRVPGGDASDPPTASGISTNTPTRLLENPTRGSRFDCSILRLAYGVSIGLTAIPEGSDSTGGRLL